MARLAEHEKIRPDWWSKSLVGVVLGFCLAVGLVGLFAWFGPGGINADAKNQFNMWMIAPLWMLILSFSYLFRTGMRAFLWLAGANVLTYSMMFLFR